MDFVAVVDQVIALLRQRGRVTYRTPKPKEDGWTAIFVISALYLGLG